MMLTRPITDVKPVSGLSETDQTDLCPYTRRLLGGWLVEWPATNTAVEKICVSTAEQHGSEA